MDGVVLLMGCDKTTPSLLMGAASCDLPTIGISGGPMLSGHFRGKQIGSGTGVWQMSEDVRAGKMTQEEFTAAESCMHRSKGHCMTMGTASTMASMVEALGVSLPGNAAIPAVDSRRYRLAQLTGRRIVEMVRRRSGAVEDPHARRRSRTPSRPTPPSAARPTPWCTCWPSPGGSACKLELEDWDKLGSTLPCLVNLQPSGKYLMEDFYYAGGLPAVLQEIARVLEQRRADRQRQDAWARTSPTRRAGIATSSRPSTSRSRPTPASRSCAATSRRTARSSSPRPRRRKLLKHRGRAVVFETIEDFKARIDDENLDIDENCIMVLKGCGPKGYPGMAEVGNMALPPKVLRKGITDMVRISDARMSGTAYGTVVLHVAPEAAAGGPLALVQDRRHHRARRAGAQAAPRRERRRAGEAPRGLEGAGAAEARLLQALCRARAAGRQGRGSRLPGGRQRHRRDARQSLRADSQRRQTPSKRLASMDFRQVTACQLRPPSFGRRHLREYSPAEAF